MDSNISAVLISQQDLAQFTERAGRLLAGIKWTPKAPVIGKNPWSRDGAIAWRESSIESQAMEEVSLLGTAKMIANDSLLYPEPVNHTLLTLRQALTIGMHLSKLYTKFSGLDQLVAQNSKGALAEMQKVEFRNKYQTASAVALFSAAYYLLWELSQYRRDDITQVPMDLSGIPEVFLQDPVRSLECFVFYLAAFVQKSGSVKSELDFVKAALLYAQATTEEIRRRSESFAYLEPFTGQIYKLVGSEFHINGFSDERSGTQGTVAFNKVRLDEIVGNREAKHYVRRLAGRLLCYDVESKRNPMFDLGGLPTVSMGFGEPGTGKSLLISALATLLEEHCCALGVPFVFLPMPDTVVSTYQGGSAERMMAWMSALKDPTKIIYAPVDDAENNLEDRTRQGVSAGVREVIGVFLRNTEGAYAVHHGNCLIQLFTNIPDQIDKAILSRINSRTYIAGAVTREDFLDQDHLWYRKYQMLDPKFINISSPKDYAFLSAQSSLSTLSAISKEIIEPMDGRIREAFHAVAKQHPAASHDFFAHFFVQVKKLFPFFSSRDLRNIQRAVDSRILDFDFPDNWFTDPGLFFRKDYEGKKEMLLDCMKKAMGQLSFAQLRLQETIRYLDSMVTISDAGKQRKIASLIWEYEVQTEARRRFSAPQNQ